jgi:hypothetical protein
MQSGHTARTLVMGEDVRCWYGPWLRQSCVYMQAARPTQCLMLRHDKVYSEITRTRPCQWRNTIRTEVWCCAWIFCKCIFIPCRIRSESYTCEASSVWVSLYQNIQACRFYKKHLLRSGQCVPRHQCGPWWQRCLQDHKGGMSDCVGPSLWTRTCVYTCRMHGTGEMFWWPPGMIKETLYNTYSYTSLRSTRVYVQAQIQIVC